MSSDIMKGWSKVFREAFEKADDAFSFHTPDGVMSLDMASMRDVGPTDFEKEHMLDFGASTTASTGSAGIVPVTAGAFRDVIAELGGKAVVMGTKFRNDNLMDALVDSAAKLKTASVSLQPLPDTVNDIDGLKLNPTFGSW